GRRGRIPDLRTCLPLPPPVHDVADDKGDRQRDADRRMPEHQLHPQPEDQEDAAAAIPAASAAAAAPGVALTAAGPGQGRTRQEQGDDGGEDEEEKGPAAVGSLHGQHTSLGSSSTSAALRSRAGPSTIVSSRTFAATSMPEAPRCTEFSISLTAARQASVAARASTPRSTTTAASRS